MSTRRGGAVTAGPWAYEVAELGGEPPTAPTAPAGWLVMDSPIGTLHLTASERGLVAVAFAETHTDQHVAPTTPPAARAHLLDAQDQLRAYFAGTRERFDLSLDLSGRRGIALEVTEYLLTMPYGQRASYAQVAAALGRPGAQRAVGSACARNPLLVVVPCHRVIRADGSIGAYRGGRSAKAWLLTHEAAVATRTASDVSGRPTAQR